MSKKPFLLVGLVLIGVALVIIGVTFPIKTEDIGRYNSYEQYNHILRNGATLYPQFLSGENVSMEEMASITRVQRDRNIEEWQEVIESSSDRILLSNALFYLSINHYANAGDFKDVESARNAVLGFDASMKFDPGDASVGYSKIQWERKRFYESALNLKQKAEEEQEKKERQKQEQQEGQAKELTPPTKGGGGGSGEDLPGLKPGVRP